MLLISLFYAVELASETISGQLTLKEGQGNMHASDFASMCMLTQPSTSLQVSSAMQTCLRNKKVLHLPLLSHSPDMSKTTRLSLFFYTASRWRPGNLRSLSISGLTSLYDFSGGYLDSMFCIDRWSSLISFCLNANVLLISC